MNIEANSKIIFVSPAKQKRDICIAFQASSLSVIFSETIRARAMKLGSCIHLEE